MKMKIRDICNSVTDGSHNPPQGIEKSEYMMLSSKNVFDDEITFEEPRYLTEEDFEREHKRTKISTGDVLLTIVGTVGRTAVVDEDMPSFALQRSVAVLHPKKDVCSARFLMYALRGKRSYIENRAKGVAQKGIYLGEVSDIDIQIPEAIEQDTIVEKLDRINNVIKQRQQELQLLDNLIKARFVELFGDPKLNDKGWNAGIVSDYYEVKGGKRIPKGMGYANGVTAHPYLRATDMKNETILDDDIHYIDEEVYEHIKRYTVKGGDIYLTNVGVNLGMAGVIPEKYDGANLTENAVKLVPKTEKVIDGIFLAHYINSPGIQDYINERKMSVGVPKLAIFRIETMPLLLPPMDIQMQFIEFCNQVDKSKFV